MKKTTISKFEKTITKSRVSLFTIEDYRIKLLNLRKSYDTIISTNEKLIDKISKGEPGVVKSVQQLQTEINTAKEEIEKLKADFEKSTTTQKARIQEAYNFVAATDFYGVYKVYVNTNDNINFVNLLISFAKSNGYTLSKENALSVANAFGLAKTKGKKTFTEKSLLTPLSKKAFYNKLVIALSTFAVSGEYDFKYIPDNIKKEMEKEKFQKRAKSTKEKQVKSKQKKIEEITK